MKKLLILPMLTMALCHAPADANMLMDLYAGAHVGVGARTMLIDDHADTVGARSYGALVGIDLPVVRVEGEYDFLANRDADLHIGMLNAYVKMPSLMLQPYIGVGIGSILGGESDLAGIDTSVAYQGMLGITLDTEILPLKFDIEGRALYASDVFEIAEQSDMLHYDARLKVRYVF